MSDVIKLNLQDKAHPEDRELIPGFSVTAFYGDDGVSVIYIDTPERWDNENGPSCRIYLNDGEPLWANPDLED
jgi:hypothetical protein